MDKKLFLLIITATLLMSCVDIKNSDIAKDLQKLTENAFFDGQMSALKGE